MLVPQANNGNRIADISFVTREYQFGDATNVEHAF